MRTQGTEYRHWFPRQCSVLMKKRKENVTCSSSDDRPKALRKTDCRKNISGFRVPLSDCGGQEADKELASA